MFMCVSSPRNYHAGIMHLLKRKGRLAGQFHQIHAKDTLEVLGAELRIGRTSNVPNPHEEPERVPPIPLWRSHVFPDSQ